MPDGSGS
jgi:hypothetical protein